MRHWAMNFAPASWSLPLPAARQPAGPVIEPPGRDSQPTGLPARHARQDVRWPGFCTAVRRDALFLARGKRLGHGDRGRRHCDRLWRRAAPRLSVRAALDAADGGVISLAATP